MNWLEALILGIVQGLTEFLPVSSSGHLELGKALLGVEAEKSLIFTIAVHGATVLSTIIVFRKYILELIVGVLKFKWNSQTQYVSKILVSMIPVSIVGVFFKDNLEALFSSKNVVFVGAMLIITALLLAFSYFNKNKTKDITFPRSIIIGIAQAFAVLPGISRSGSTIAAGLMLGNKKTEIAKFSFLMVIIPILGKNVLGLFKGEFTNNVDIGVLPLLIGFFAAFISGLFACSWMINIVKRGKLIYFAVYCVIIGIIAIIFG